MANERTCGGPQNFPSRLASRVPIDRVIYWSTPLQSSSIDRAMFCDLFGLLIMLPCFWPHLCFCSCCICAYLSSESLKSLGTDVVVTSTSIELIQENSSKSISFESIKSITVTNTTDECLPPKPCHPEIPRLKIDELRRQILEAKDNMNSMQMLPLK